jgi:hypothetical protein
MTNGFTKALAKAGWTIPGALHQTRIFGEVVSSRPNPVAYFLVDAMRFEMGIELADRLPKSAEVSVRPASAALPSITPIGMAALMPGAGSSFSVVEQAGKLGARIETSFLPDLANRKKFAAARVPKLVDIALDEVLSLQPSKLARKIDGGQIIVVRSQEIDHAGIEHSVVTADHGHLFLPSDRDESMRIDAPGGQTIELHRRCWIGRGGATPPGCVRVPAAGLGYDSDLDVVFPAGAGVFKAGGDLAYHHGGASLQELVIPVLTVRAKVEQPSRASSSPFAVTGSPTVVTNRIFSVVAEVGGHNLALFANPVLVRPLLMAAGKQVGSVGMTIGGEFDRSTGCVTLPPNTPVTIAFLLTDETVPTIRLVLQDPATDAELYRSPADIPVRLGV